MQNCWSMKEQSVLTVDTDHRINIKTLMDILLYLRYMI
jgi:hypothetical protein